MMIKAVALFEFKDADAFKKHKYELSAEPKEALKGGLFSHSLLDDFKKRTLPCIDLKYLDAAGIGSYKIDTDYNLEYHFFSLFTDKQTNRIVLSVIVSKTDLVDKERYYLFRNLEHVYHRGDTLKFDLKDILERPVEFNAKDAQLNKVQQVLDATKEMTFKNRDLLLERDKQLKQEIEKTANMENHATSFKLSATKVKENSMSCWDWFFHGASQVTSRIIHPSKKPTL